MQRARIAVGLLAAGLILSYPGLGGMLDQLLAAANTTAGLCLGGVIIALVITLGTVMVSLVAQWRGMINDQNRPVDGSYPLQRVKNRDGSTTIVVPDNIYDVGVRVLPNGEVVALSQNIPMPLFASFRAAVEGKHRVQAAIPGDKVYTSSGGGWLGRLLGGNGRGSSAAIAPPRVTAPMARLAAGAYDKHPRQVVDSTAYSVPTPEEKTEEVEEIAPPARQVTAIEAFRGNTNTNFALGQTAQGEVVYWDCTETPHIRFHGKSQGSGKTNAIKQVVLGAVRSGANVILLDRRNFKDWGDYRQHVECVDTRDPLRFVDAITQLCDIYQDRDRQLGEAGVGTIAKLKRPLSRIFVVISEFGTLCNSADATGLLNDILQPLERVLCESGATGVHLIIEDQVVGERWNLVRAARANSTPITGYLPVNSASAGDYSNAHKLKRFSFHYEGDIFKTWDMDMVAPQMLESIQPMPRGRVLKPANAVRKEVVSVATPVVAPVAEQRTPIVTEQPFDPRKADNREIIFHWRKQNPAGSQAEFREWCETQGVDIARGYVSDTFALYELWQWRDSHTAGSQAEYNNWRVDTGKAEVPSGKLVSLWATYDRIRKPTRPAQMGVYRDSNGIRPQ